MDFLFLLGSTRRDGNTEALARQAATHLPAEANQSWLRLSDLPLPTFGDVRHEGEGTYPQPVDNERVLLEATLGASDLVIASPLYWYSVSASTKTYLDHWTAWLRVPGADFKNRMRGKTMWAITAHTSQDTARVEPLLGTLRLTADYMGMRWGGELLGYGNRPGQVLEDAEALARARTLFTSRAVRA
ncbi:flavodoxin family protein [Streptosporangium sp. 'caverna']|uniref:flavodoxin family protein n=1 Tax=Streptosporangium sp. 'caverna' TaxID=2202249 RepID=UPI001955044B|nr:NAD(P)H-dependent oxidoreductase [Streptosporangium sp. 'caverna']